MYRIAVLAEQEAERQRYAEQITRFCEAKGLFQGGVEFPTGGKSGGAKGVPWRRRGVCDRADESATRACVGSHAG